MKLSTAFIVCLFLGASSWAICSIFFGVFEPFDAGFGLLIGQAMMLFFMLYIGWFTSFKHIFVCTLALYLSQNAYAYIFGSSEHRAWALLLLLTSLALCIVPLVAGLFSRAIKIGYTAYIKSR